MLFAKELKKICLNFVYLLFLCLLLLSWYNNFRGVTDREISASKSSETSVFSEFAGGSILKKPELGAQSYGTKPKEVPSKIMCGGTDLLIMEYLKNSYAAYPFSYYKEVVLNEEDQNKILDIIKEITGLTEAQITSLPDGYFPAVNGNIIHMGNDPVQTEGGSLIFEASASGDTEDTGDVTEHFVSQVSYDRFQDLMREVEEILGPGSRYSMEMLTEYFGQEEMTYDEAMEEYQKTIYDDRVSGAFARLFCDYMTRSLGLYPVFVTAAFWLRDRRSRMEELIGSRQIGTAKFILTRCCALLTAVMVPVILLSFESLIPLLKYSADTGISVDPFAFIKYILWWLLPTAMIVISLGTLLTVLTSSPAAIAVQFLWWFADSSITSLSGDVRLYTLMIRHNMLRGSELIQENFAVICLNRGLLVLASALFLWLSIVIYKRKRGGGYTYEYTIQKRWSIFKSRLSAHIQK